MNKSLSGSESGLMLNLDMEETEKGSSLVLRNNTTYGSSLDAVAKGSNLYTPRITDGSTYISQDLGLSNTVKSCKSTIKLKIVTDYFQDVLWSTGETSKEIQPSTSNTYTVKVQTDRCMYLFDTSIVMMDGAIYKNESHRACANDTLWVRGKFYTQAGTFSDTLFSSNQCDTMITMDVQFLNNSTSELEIETCPNGVVIYGGVSIAAGSSHNFNFLNAAGCDSTLTVFALGTLVLRDTISLVSCDTLDYAGMRLPPNSMHDITLQSAQGCDSIVTVRVVPDERNDNFLGPDLAICANEFVLSGLGDETVWNGSITSKNLTVTISGAYTALHVATDGCTYEDTVVLNFSNVAIFIPNAFTPNSDDLNECFAPILGGSAQFVLNYQFRIYNLYGQRIFSTEDPEECWTGIVQEDNSQGDVYFWMLEGYNSACDLRINQSGTVTMLR